MNTYHQRNATYAPIMAPMNPAIVVPAAGAVAVATAATTSKPARAGNNNSAANGTMVLMDITATVCGPQPMIVQPEPAVQSAAEQSDNILPEHADGCNVANMDPTMTSDPRIIVNLLAMERSTMPTCDYFRVVQREILPFMRKVVTTWMLEVCDEQRCEEQVFPLAINYMDRFLCMCPISKNQFQLLGAVCLLMATKIRQCYALTADLLCAYTEYSVTKDEIRNWELLMLATLQWNVNGTTAFDFVDHILVRVPWGRENPHIRQHAHTLVSVCCTEMMFMCVPPSLLASACICAATRGVNAPSARYALRDVCLLTQSDPLDVEFTVHHIENVVAAETAALQEQQHKQLQHQQLLPQPQPQQCQMQAHYAQQQPHHHQTQQPAKMSTYVSSTSPTDGPNVVFITSKSRMTSSNHSINSIGSTGSSSRSSSESGDSPPKHMDDEDCLNDSGVMDDNPDTPTDENTLLF